MTPTRQEKTIQYTYATRTHETGQDNDKDTANDKYNTRQDKSRQRHDKNKNQDNTTTQTK